MSQIPDTLAQLSVPVDNLVPYSKNPRRGDVGAIKSSLEFHGQYKPIVVRSGTFEVLAGNHTLQAAKDLGWGDIAATFVDVSDDEAARIVLVDNRSNDVAGYDDAALQELLAELPDLAGTGFSEDDLDGMAEGAEDAAQNGSLVERFGVPPFSVLDARGGAWTSRKAAWKDLGIHSEVGRDADMVYGSPQTKYSNWYEVRNRADERAGRRVPDSEVLAEYAGDLVAAADSGTSIFDPVLTELMYRWFCPPGGHVLDPWAGGSVRGLVAARLGRRYTGIELREEQVAANREQGGLASGPLPAMLAAAPGMADRAPAAVEDSTPDVTPVEEHAGVLVKREDAWTRGGAAGAKARAMFTAAEGAAGIVTAGSRNSAQIERAALVAEALGLPCRIHTGFGKDTPEIATARRAGAEVFQHRPARLTTIKARFREDSEGPETAGYAVFPFGMDHPDYLQQVAEQTANVPADVQRVVAPYGSGMTLAGVLRGLADDGRADLPVVAVSVGQGSHDYLDRYAPGWQQRVEIVQHPSEYDQPAADCQLGALTLDPIYEAKCVEYLQAGDLLWTVGVRASALEPAQGEPAAANPEPYWIVGESTTELQQLEAEQYDFLIGCPPYYDLEVYSDDPRDMSNMAPADFDQAMIANVQAAAERLRPNSYAAFVVSAVRNRRGNLMDMRSLMVRAAGEAGMTLQNDAILVTPIGTLAVRAGRSFTATRSLARGHQDVLIFLKGDRKAAAGRASDIETKASLDALEDVEVTHGGDG